MVPQVQEFDHPKDRNRLCFLLLPQYALSFLQLFPDVSHKYPNVHHTFGCPSLFFSNLEPPPEDDMHKLFMFYQDCRDAWEHRRRDAASQERYATVSGHFQCYLLEQASLRKVPEDGELAIMRTTLEQKRGRAAGEDSDCEEAGTEYAPNKSRVHQAKRLRKAMDSLRPLARMPSKLNNNLTGVLTNPPPGCCRGIGQVPFCLSEAQANAIHIWRATPRLQELCQLLVSSPHRPSDVRRLRLRSRIQEVPATLLSYEDAKTWLLDELRSAGHVETIARWCVKQVTGRTKKSVCAAYSRRLWAHLHAESCLQPVFAYHLPRGLLAECVPQIYDRLRDGDVLGFQRSPITSDQLAGPVRIDTSMPASSVIGLPPLCAKMHGADYDGDTGTFNVPDSEFKEQQMARHMLYEHLRYDATGKPNLEQSLWAGYAIKTLMSGGKIPTTTTDVSGGDDVYWKGGQYTRLGRCILEKALGNCGHGHVWIEHLLRPSDIKEVGIRAPAGAPALSATGWLPVPALPTTQEEDDYVFAILRHRGWSEAQLEHVTIVRRRWSRNLNMPTALAYLQGLIMALPENDVLARDLQKTGQRPAAIEELEEESDSANEEHCEPAHNPREAARLAAPAALKLATLPALADFPDGILTRMPMYISADARTPLRNFERSWLRFLTSLANIFHMRAGYHSWACLDCRQAGVQVCGSCGDFSDVPRQTCRACACPYLHAPSIVEEQGRLQCSSCQSHRIEESGAPRPWRSLRLSWAAEGLGTQDRHAAAVDCIKRAVRRCPWRPSQAECKIVCAQALLHLRRQPQPGFPGLALEADDCFNTLELPNFMDHLKAFSSVFAHCQQEAALNILHRHERGNANDLEELPQASISQLMQHYHLAHLGTIVLTEDGDVKFSKFDYLNDAEPLAFDVEGLIAAVQSRLTVPRCKADLVPMPLLTLKVSANYSLRPSQNPRTPAKVEERERRLLDWRRFICSLCHPPPLRLTVEDVIKAIEAQLGPKSATAIGCSFEQGGAALSMVLGANIRCNDLVPLDDTPLMSFTVACNKALNRIRAGAADCLHLDYQTEVRGFLLQHYKKVVEVASRAHLFGHDIGPLTALLESTATDLPNDCIRVALRDGRHVLLHATDSSKARAFREYRGAGALPTPASNTTLTASLTTPATTAVRLWAADEAQRDGPPGHCSLTGRWRPGVWLLSCEGQVIEVGVAAAWIPPSGPLVSPGPDSRLSDVLERLCSCKGQLRHRHTPHVLEPAHLFVTERDAGIGAKPRAQSFTTGPVVAPHKLLKRANREVGLLGNEVSPALSQQTSHAITEAASLGARQGTFSQLAGVSLVARCRRTAVDNTNSVRLQHGILTLAQHVDAICRRPLDSLKPLGEICGERLQALSATHWRCLKCGMVPAPPAVEIRLSEHAHAVGLTRDVRSYWDWRMRPAQAQENLTLLQGDRLHPISKLAEAGSIFAKPPWHARSITRLPSGFQVSDDEGTATVCATLGNWLVYTRRGSQLGCRRPRSQNAGPVKTRYATLLSQRDEHGEYWELASNELILLKRTQFVMSDPYTPVRCDALPTDNFEQLLQRVRQRQALPSDSPALVSKDATCGEGVDDPERLSDIDGESDYDVALSDSELSDRQEDELCAAQEGLTWAEVIGPAEPVCEEVDGRVDLDKALDDIILSLPPDEEDIASTSYKLEYFEALPFPDINYTCMGLAPVGRLCAESYGSAMATACQQLKGDGTRCEAPSTFRLLANAAFRHPSLFDGVNQRRSLTTLCDACIAMLDKQYREAEQARKTQLERGGFTDGAILSSTDPEFCQRFYAIYCDLQRQGVPLALVDTVKEASQLPDFAAVVHRQSGFVEVDRMVQARNKSCEHLSFYLNGDPARGKSMLPWELAALLKTLQQGPLIPTPSSILTPHYRHPFFEAIFRRSSVPISLTSVKDKFGPPAARACLGTAALLATLTADEKHFLDDARSGALWAQSLRARELDDPPGIRVVPRQRRALIEHVAQFGLCEEEAGSQAASGPEEGCDDSDCELLASDDGEGQSDGELLAA